MGRGIALQFKFTYPDNYRLYRTACTNRGVVPGEMFVYSTKKTLPRYIINFPTKRHWMDNSLIEDIKSGLLSLISVINLNNIKSIAIPPLGCGLGGLDWRIIKPLIESSLSGIKGLDAYIYEPYIM